MKTPPDPHAGDRDVRSDPATISWSVVLLVTFLVGLGVWQFASLAPQQKDFPTDHVDMAIRGDKVVVYNPTAEIVDLFQISVLRLSGTYSYTDRNLKPQSSRVISLKKLRKNDGRRYDPGEEGECRIRLEYWRGTDKDEVSRFCRGF